MVEEWASVYGVGLEWSDEGRNGGYSAGEVITLYSFDEDWICEVSFWHELGHVLLLRLMGGRPHYLSKLSCEGAAWELGLCEAAKHGRVWDVGSRELLWVREQFASYVNGEYD